MTKRELNKLPDGGLTAALLKKLGLKELMAIALHCFDKWHCEKQHSYVSNELNKRQDENFSAQIKQLEWQLYMAKQLAEQEPENHRRTLEALEKAWQQLEQQEAKNKRDASIYKAQIKELKQDMARLKLDKPVALRKLQAEVNRLRDDEARAWWASGWNKEQWDRAKASNDRLWAENERLRAEIQRLKQHLATHLVPVPGNPGMSFISYPN